MLERLKRYSKVDIYRNAGGTLATRVALVGFALVNTVLTARLLGPEGRGIIAAGLALVGIGMMLGNLGLPMANAYFAARDRRLLPAILGNSLAVSVLLGALISTLTWAVCKAYPHLAPVPGMLLTVTLVWIPFNLWSSLVQSTLLGLNRVREFNLLDLSNRVSITVAIGILLAVGHATVGMVFGCMFLAMLPATLWGNHVLLGQAERRPTLSRALLASCIEYGYKVWVGQLSAYFVVSFDLLMVNEMLGRRDAGLYSIAGGLGACIMMLGQVLSTVLFPTLASLPTFEERWRLVRKGSVISGVYAIAVCLLAGVLARPLIVLLFGASFEGAVTPFLWLLPGLVCYTISGVVSAAYNASEHPVISLLPAPLLVAFNITLNLYWIPRWGITGAAACSSITYALWLASAFIYAHYYRKHYAARMDERRAASLQASPPTETLG